MRVDLREAGGGHGDAHDALALGGGVADGKLAVALRPFRDLVGAVCVLEEGQLHIALVVGDALGDRIHKTVLGQIGRLRGNTGHGGNDLILDDVAAGSGGGVRVTVADAGCAAAVGPGIGHGLAHGLFKTGDAGHVFRVEHGVIDPFAAVYNGGHGQGDQEGRGGFRDHLWNAGLDHQVQTQGQAVHRAVTVGVRFGHGRASRELDESLRCVARCRAVGVQRVFEAVDQHVGGVVIDRFAALRSVCRGKAIIGGDVEDVQKGQVQLAVFDAVQQLRANGIVICLGIGENVRELHIGKLDAAHGIAVCVAIGVERGDAGGIAQNGLHTACVPDAGADIGAVPYAVLLSPGEIVLIQTDGAGARGVDQVALHGIGVGRHTKAADHDEGQQQRKEFFHDSQSSFRLR